MYKAKISIGGFKAGDVVPDEIAEIWDCMYKVSPVEKVEDEKKLEPKAFDKSKEENPKDSKKESKDILQSPNWIDDYLARNMFVVLKNIYNDNHTKQDLHYLLEQEKSNKNRSKVVKLLKQKIKGD